MIKGVESVQTQELFNEFEMRDQNYAIKNRGTKLRFYLNKGPKLQLSKIIVLHKLDIIINYTNSLS